jgi:WD40 repeat protein
MMAEEASTTSMMKSTHLLAAAIAGTATTIVWVAPTIALAPEEINQLASNIVARIDGDIDKNNGTGFIVARNGNRYTVLTNEHVVRNSTNQRLTMPDGRVYRFSSQQIKVWPGDVDLAVIEFESDREYAVAKLGNFGDVRGGNTVYTYGFNAANQTYPERSGRFLSGSIVSIVNNANRGYRIVFQLSALGGLSGSPILNSNGEVIGIYGQGDPNNRSLTFGIPITTYQQLANSPSVATRPTPRPTPTPTPDSPTTGRTDNSNFQIAYSVDNRSSVGSVAISADGKTIVSGSSGSNDNTIKVWRLADGQLLRTLSGHENWVNSVAISADGKTIVSGSSDGTIKVWRLADGKLLRTLTVHKDIVYSVAISADGKTIVSGGRDGTIKVWRLADGQLLRTLSGHENWVSSVAISADGQAIVSGSSDRTIKVWRLADGKLLRTLTGHQDWIYSVAISADGQTIVSGSLDNTIKVWRRQD